MRGRPVGHEGVAFLDPETEEALAAPVVPVLQITEPSPPGPDDWTEADDWLLDCMAYRL